MGAQSTTTTSQSPLTTWLRSSRSASTSSAPGMTVSSSAVIGIDPGGVEDRHQVALDLAPRALEPALRVDLVHPQVRGHLDGFAAHLAAERVAERVRGVGGEDEGALAGPGGERRRTGRAGGLPDPALAGEQDDANAHGSASSIARQRNDSTRFFRPFRAVSMMTFSALRSQQADHRDAQVDGQAVGDLGRRTRTA